jgi:hypothetical protein
MGENGRIEFNQFAQQLDLQFTKARMLVQKANDINSPSMLHACLFL